MNKEEISVSIICATYNHEKYLKYALNSILNQKTTFKFEVLVGEDCSTDDSRKILKYYEEKYPNFFTIFYRKKNFGPIKNFIDLYYRAKGKYLVVLETDDFWIDELKLQKSFDFLESNNDYIAVSHRCIIVDENNNSIGKQYPECHKSEYSYDEYMKDLLPGQTTTVMFRNFFLKELNYSIELLTEDKYCIGPGDARKAFTFIVNGKVACLPDVMSAYRLVTSGGSSYSANVKRNPCEIIKRRKAVVEYSRKCLDNSKALYVSEYLLIRDIFMGIIKRNGVYTISQLLSEIKKTENKLKILLNVIKYLLYSIIRKIRKKNKTYLPSNINNENKILKCKKSIYDIY